jgi:hypothetical protein
LSLASFTDPGIFDRKECGLFYDSLAFAVQVLKAMFGRWRENFRNLLREKFIWQDLQD